jgi:hypothetical protein
MSEHDPNWLAALHRAAGAAERSSAPDWLKEVLRAAISEAGALAPVADEEVRPPDFIYPH